jgi:hypothetical protein
MATVTSFDAMFRDLYPQPGDRIKQWVVDSRRESAWESQTCPKVDVPEHDDNTGTGCRNVGRLPWTYLRHDCCSECEDIHDQTASRPDVVAWLAEKAARPPVEADRSKYSDQRQPEYPALRAHPLLGGR